MSLLDLFRARNNQADNNDDEDENNSKSSTKLKIPGYPSIDDPASLTTDPISSAGGRGESFGAGPAPIISNPSLNTLSNTDINRRPDLPIPGLQPPPVDPGYLAKATEGLLPPK